MSKDIITQMTAKAALTQMIEAVFARMEMACVVTIGTHPFSAFCRICCMI
jgi:hypothetical protein